MTHILGHDHSQLLLLPEAINVYVDVDNPLLSTRIHQMDWAGRTEDRGNAGETAGSFFHPSGPSEFVYLIQRKGLILHHKLAPGADRTPFHPVNPGFIEVEIIDNI